MYRYREIHSPAKIIIPIVAFISLILLGIAVQLSITESLDQRILGWFASWRSPDLDYFFKIITWLGSLYFWGPIILIASLIFFYYYDRVYSLLLGISFFGAVVTTFILKHLVSRLRPELASETDYFGAALSFPSGHATQVTAAAMILWLLLRRIEFRWSVIVTPVLLTIVFIVAVSRLYLQVHYPSDILAGELIAILWVSTLHIWIRRRESRQYLQRS